jgi:hypothetical protein
MEDDGKESPSGSEQRWTKPGEAGVRRRALKDGVNVSDQSASRHQESVNGFAASVLIRSG